MRRIIVLNTKGGCGKTTLATNLASYYACHGLPPALLDYDPQASSTRWLRVRGERRQDVYGVEAFREHRQATRTWQLRVPDATRRVIIDAPAAIEPHRLIEFVRQADTVLIPVLPSPIDIHAAARFIQDLLLVAKVRALRTRLGVVANRVKANTVVYRALERFLDNLQFPFVARLRDSQNYVRAAEQGLGVHELPGARAARDREDWQPLLDWVETPAARRAAGRRAGS